VKLRVVVIVAFVAVLGVAVPGIAVTNTKSNSLSIIDTDTLISVGKAPHGMALRPGR
jgi:YVTN family beta-propeller protein